MSLQHGAFVGIRKLRTQRYLNDKLLPDAANALATQFA